MATRDENEEFQAVQGRPTMYVPIGLEQLLGMAAVDDGFCHALVSDWRRTVAASGFELVPAEAQILDAIGATQLHQMVARVDERLVVDQRRSFLAQATATLLALAGGVAVVSSAAGCPSRETKTQPPQAGQPVGRPRKPTRETTPLQPRAGQPADRPPRPPLKRSPTTRPIDRPAPPPAGIRPRPRPHKQRGIRPNRLAPAKKKNVE